MWVLFGFVLPPMGATPLLTSFVLLQVNKYFFTVPVASFMRCKLQP
jgi:hypothetical protein